MDEATVDRIAVGVESHPRHPSPTNVTPAKAGVQLVHRRHPAKTGGQLVHRRHPSGSWGPALSVACSTTSRSLKLDPSVRWDDDKAGRQRAQTFEPSTQLKGLKCGYCNGLRASRKKVPDSSERTPESSAFPLSIAHDMEEATVDRIAVGVESHRRLPSPIVVSPVPLSSPQPH